MRLHLCVDGSGSLGVEDQTNVQYTPREAEIKAYLEQWAIYCYRLQRAEGAKDFEWNYYYLTESLAQKCRAHDVSHNAKVMSGVDPEEDVIVRGTRLTRLNGNKGEAVVSLYRIFGTGTQADKQRWDITVPFEVDAVAAKKKADHDPMMARLNPLGVMAIAFHEDRLREKDDQQ